jgi:ABC-type dipeptide/oligopeptide/nickel transport system permease subunit
MSTTNDAPDDLALAEAEAVIGLMGAENRAGPRFRRTLKIGLWIAIGWLVLIVGTAILAPILPLASPGKPVGVAKLGIGWRWPEPLGTDKFARSNLSRVIYGARQSAPSPATPAAGSTGSSRCSSTRSWPSRR